MEAHTGCAHCCLISLSRCPAQVVTLIHNDEAGVTLLVRDQWLIRARNELPASRPHWLQHTRRAVTHSSLRAQDEGPPAAHGVQYCSQVWAVPSLRCVSGKLQPEHQRPPLQGEGWGPPKTPCHHAKVLVSPESRQREGGALSVSSRAGAGYPVERRASGFFVHRDRRRVPEAGPHVSDCVSRDRSPCGCSWWSDGCLLFPVPEALL